MEKINIDGVLPPALFKSALIESFDRGIVLLSQKGQPFYLNRKAKELCQQLGNSNERSNNLPPVITEIHHQLTNNRGFENQICVLECQGTEEQTIRIWGLDFNLKFDEDFSQGRFILIVIENRNETLQQEMRIEQKKYNLTERETQIWKLRLQRYTYQEIAKCLKISLNTVKFHLKNIYAKRLSAYSKEIIIL